MTKAAVGNIKSIAQERSEGTKVLTGEILDPKCYFGVMKPGEGKVHKSCAIRCISGGIPPVLRHGAGDNSDPYQYYIILDSNGKKINDFILPFVAEPVQLTGEVKRVHGWNFIYVDPKDIMLQDF